MLKLKPRLQMAADSIRKGSRLADIGTDHAYLPAAVILDGTVPSAIAADLRKCPLENAGSTVNAYGIEDKVQLRLSDGLNAVYADEVDDIVIAGMGGILIKEILEKTDWIKDVTKRFILQPQSHSEELREFLWNNGFEIFNEKACFEDGKVYICFCAEFIDKITEHSETEKVFGGYLTYNNDAAKAFVKKKFKRITERKNALEKAGINADELKILSEITDEVIKWQQ